MATRDRTTTRAPARWPLVTYLITAVLVRAADEGARVALVLLALDRAGSAALGGELVAALMIPHVVAAPLAGSLADRVRRRRLFHATALSLFGLCLIAAALLVGSVNPLVVLAIVVVGGCCGPLLTGGLTGLLRELAPGRELAKVYGMDSVSYNLAGICGPALVGVLATAVGPVVTTMTLGGVVVAGAVPLLTLPLAAREPDARRGTNLLDVRGLVALWHNRKLRAVTLASSVGQVGVGAVPLVAAVLAGEHHQLNAAGLLVSSFAVGGLLGSIVYSRLPVGSARPERVVMVGLLAVAAPLLLVPLVPSLVIDLGLFAAAGCGTGPLVNALFTTRHREAPPDAHTQVFTLGAGMKSTAAALGAAVSGLAAGWAGAALVLGAAACQLVGAAAGTLILRGRAEGNGDADAL